MVFAYLLQVLLFILIVTTAKGFKIKSTQLNNEFQKNLSFSSENFQYPSFSIENSNFPVQPFTRQYQNVNEGPIAGYPKVPPLNAYESGGVDGDLLPPLLEFNSDQKRRNQFFRRSAELEKVGVNPQPSYPMFVSTGYENSGENQEILKLSSENPLKNIQEQQAIDPKTGYPLIADSKWQDAGGNGDTLDLPLEGDVQKPEEKVDSKTGYPLQAQPHWKDAGGNADILELPLEDSLSPKNYENGSGVDPKTGYPLKAEPFWRDAGGDADILELPLEDSLPDSLSSKTFQNNNAVDPKTGYPLKAESHWKDAGGNEDILELPLENASFSKNSENESAIDPKTGYPLRAEPFWKDAGGNEDILELPLESALFSKNSENESAIDPKTGYPLRAEPFWKDAGGNEDILELPLEDILSSKTIQNNNGVDQKTGYPLKAEPHWKDAGGNEDILQLPFESSVEETNKKKFDSKTVYPLTAENSWKDAGGNGDILDLPMKFNEEKKNTDKKTGYFFVAEPNLRNANGNKEIIDLPLQNNMNKFIGKSEVEAQTPVNLKTNYPFFKSPITGTGVDTQHVSNIEKNLKVDPKTGYPLVAQSEWSFAGGDGNILQPPINNYVNPIQGRMEEIIDEDLLTKLRPPSPESNYNTGFASFPSTNVPLMFTQTPVFGSVQFFDNNRSPRRPFGESENTKQQKIYTPNYSNNAVLTVLHYTKNNQNVKSSPERLTNFNQKQFIQSFTGQNTQNNNENLFPFPIIHTAVNQQFKTYQPSEISNFQIQQHKFKQHSPLFISNIASSFT